MPVEIQELEGLLRDAFPSADITVRDMAGNGDHYAANIVAEEFANKNRVQQHQMVYAALKGKMQKDLHALALQTSAPSSKTGNMR